MITLFKYEFKRQNIFLLIMIFISFLAFFLSLDSESDIFTISTFKAIAIVGVIGTVFVIGTIGVIRSLSEDIEDSSPLIANIPLSGPKIMFVKLTTTLILIVIIAMTLLFFTRAGSLISAYLSKGPQAFITQINYTFEYLDENILSGLKSLIVAAIYISMLYLAFVMVKAIFGKVSFLKIVLIILILLIISTIAVTLIANILHLGYSFDNNEFFPAYIMEYDRSISSTLNGYYKPYIDFSNHIDKLDERYEGVNNINIFPSLATLVITGLNLYLAGIILDRKVTF